MRSDKIKKGLERVLHRALLKSKMSLKTKTLIRILVVGIVLVGGWGGSSEVYSETQEVTITTDKTEYEQGETVKITIFNGLVEDISVIDSRYLSSSSARLERKTKLGEWEEIALFPDERVLGYKLLKPGEKHVYSWDQLIFNRTTSKDGRAEPGIYRIGIDITEGTTGLIKFKGTVYSNEFIIK